MIFNKKYDDVLWLILEGSKKEGREILDFLKYIPNDLLIQIAEGLKQFDGVSKKESLQGEAMAQGGLSYWYRINQVGMLEIGERFIDGDDVVNLTYLYIYPLDVNEIINNKEKSVLLAGISYHYDQPFENNTLITSEDMIIFSLVKNSIGGYKIETYDNKPKYHRVNVNNIPNDLKINDLDNVKKLIRFKKNSSK